MHNLCEVKDFWWLYFLAGEWLMIKTTLFAGGCFWGMEASFQQVPGVVATQVGYAGGTTENPTYREVCCGETGHAETVQVTYDTDQISYQELLKAFFTSHDPTTADPNGCDFGSQYRSIVFYNDDEERKIARRMISRLTRTQEIGCIICTELTPTAVFYPAEDYHQQYYQRHGLLSDSD